MIRNIIIIVALLASGYLFYEITRLYTATRESELMPAEFTIGPANATLDVVEYLNYDCKYCKEAHPTIMRAVEKDTRVRYIPRPLSAESPDSKLAARLVYAAGRQGKFREMHNALMENYRTLNDETLTEIAARADVDLAQAKKDMESSEIDGMVKRNGTAFKKLGGNATPTFFIGGKMKYVPKDRMPEVADFLSMFHEARGMQQ